MNIYVGTNNTHFLPYAARTTKTHASNVESHIVGYVLASHTVGVAMPGGNPRAIGASSRKQMVSVDIDFSFEQPSISGVHALRAAKGMRRNAAPAVRNAARRNLEQP